MSKDQVIALIYHVIDTFNAHYADQYHLEKSEDTVLFGIGGVLDSLGLVNFILAVEEKIEETEGRPMVLADARAVSQKNSPFRTVKTLAEYVHGLLEKET